MKMQQQTRATIFLADSRLVEQSASFQVQHTFYTDRKSDSSLYNADDVLLAGGSRYNFKLKEESAIVVLPLAGAVKYEETIIAAGQVLYVQTNAEEELSFTNPFADETVNFLIIIFAGNYFLEKAVVQSFDVNKYQDVLVQITPQVSTIPFKLSIGKFKGRTETICPIPSNSKFYSFVLQGAFEIEGRLLLERDALLLWNCTTGEVEALSNDAILLTVQLSA